MSAGVVIEEVRFPCEGELLRGAWHLPRATPPLPVILLAPGPVEDGAPRAIVLLRALERHGLAAFRCLERDATVDPVQLLRAAWRRARDHSLLSRSRTGLLVLPGVASTATTALGSLAECDLPRVTLFAGCTPDGEAPEAASLTTLEVDDPRAAPQTIAATLKHLLRPTWDPAWRPPGTAIG